VAINLDRTSHILAFDDPVLEHQSSELKMRVKWVKRYFFTRQNVR
jgi:hypothetical protein